MELQANPGSLGLTRFLPWNQSPGRGFFSSEHRELSEVTRPASDVSRWLGPAYRGPPPCADAGAEEALVANAGASFWAVENPFFEAPVHSTTPNKKALERAGTNWLQVN